MTNLLPQEAADRLRVSKGTLANWRTSGYGPRFVKFGRRVLYPETELAAFEQKNLRSNTAEMVVDSLPQ
jgi:predicted site-specific integrase-resolvase